MFAWVSRYNGSMPELGTLDNTCKRGTMKEIMRFAKTYGKGYNSVMVSFYYNENNKYGVPDKKVVFDSLDRLKFS